MFRFITSVATTVSQQRGLSTLTTIYLSSKPSILANEFHAAGIVDTLK